MGFRKPFSQVVLKSANSPPGQIGVVKGANHGGPGAVQKAEAEEKTAHLMAQAQALETLLQAGLERDPHVAVGAWGAEPTLADLPGDADAVSQPIHDRFVPAPLGLIESLAPGAAARHAKAVAEGEAALAAAMADWRRQNERRAEALAALKAQVDAHNQALEAIEAKLKAGEPETVRWYAGQVLAASPYPHSLHRQIEVTSGPTPRRLTVSLTVPDAKTVTPPFERYRFARAKGEVVPIKRSPEDTAALYARTIAQLALRTLHELFVSDVGHAIDVVDLRIAATAPDPSTGKPTTKPLASVGVSRADFEDIELAHVDPIACLDRLKTLSRAAG